MGNLGLFFLRGDWPEKKRRHPLSADIFDAVRELQSAVTQRPSVLVHMDYWHGNVLWHENRVSAVLDWDHASYGDPAIDVAYFRMNMYLRGIKRAADIFLKRYEEASGLSRPEPRFLGACRGCPTAAGSCTLDSGVPRDGRRGSHR